MSIEWHELGSSHLNITPNAHRTILGSECVQHCRSYYKENNTSISYIRPLIKVCKTKKLCRRKVNYSSAQTCYN